MTGDNVVPLIRGEKKFQATPTKQDLGTSQGFSSNFPTSTLVLFIWDLPPTGCRLRAFLCENINILQSL